MLGILAAVVGSAFLGLQNVAWFVLGCLYILLGLLYVTGKIGLLMRSFGPDIRSLRSPRGAVTLGILFGLNMPECSGESEPALIPLDHGAASGLSIRSYRLFGIPHVRPLLPTAAALGSSRL